MKYIIYKELGCVYRDNNGVIEYAPLYSDGGFYEEEFANVEEELVELESVPANPHGHKVLKDVYKWVREQRTDDNAERLHLQQLKLNVVHAMLELNEAWNNELLEHYPKQLPSFDELTATVRDISFIKE